MEQASVGDDHLAGVRVGSRVALDEPGGLLAHEPRDELERGADRVARAADTLEIVARRAEHVGDEPQGPRLLAHGDVLVLVGRRLARGDHGLPLPDLARRVDAAPRRHHHLDEQVRRARGDGRQQVVGEALCGGRRGRAFRRVRFADREDQRFARDRRGKRLLRGVVLHAFEGAALTPAAPARVATRGAAGRRALAARDPGEGDEGEGDRTHAAILEEDAPRR